MIPFEPYTWNPVPDHLHHVYDYCYYLLFIETTKIVIMTSFMAVIPFEPYTWSPVPDHLPFIHYCRVLNLLFYNLL